jgi:hypothetical protein
MSGDNANPLARQERRSTRAALLVPLALFVFLPATGSAQVPVPPPSLDILRVPFHQWVAEGQRQEIPWKLDFWKPWLRLDQRIGFSVNATVSGKQLAQLGPAHDLYLGARLGRPDGEWLGHGIVGAQIEKPLEKNVELRLTLGFLVRPGKYVLAVFLYDDTTKKRSFLASHLEVPPLRKDPLAGSDRDLAAVELVPGESGLDAFFNPRITSRLSLPVVTRRPLRVEVIANTSGSDGESGAAERRSLGFAITGLKLFSQLEVANGTLHLTALDIPRRKVLFEQEEVRSIDWLGLRAALDEIDPFTISAQALQGRKENAAFFRNTVMDKLRERFRELPASAPTAGNGSPSSPGTPRPLRVFIIVTPALTFPRGADMTPVPAEACDDCRVYLLRRFSRAPLIYEAPFLFEGRGRRRNPFAGRSGAYHDQLQRILKPLEPRTFNIYDAADLRRALAQILADLRQY